MTTYEIDVPIRVFDTTLRDGEQSSGFHMMQHEKLRLARKIAEMGVDIIEAGFPISSPGDAKSVYAIASEIGKDDGPVICALSRAVDADIEAAAQAIAPARTGRIHTFIATSDIHIKDKLRKSRQQIIDIASHAVEKARSYTTDVEWSCEDFGRTDNDYTVQVVCAAIKAGATTINLPDTVGWLRTWDVYAKVDDVIKKVRAQGLDAVFSVHNHNDFGNATATTIEAVRAGCRQVEVTVNGIGERAGNASLEEVVANLREHGMARTNIDTKMIGPVSKLLTEVTGVKPQPNKPIVGDNAFAHEAGIHQHGMLKARGTYEVMDPADYGMESVITFGPRSGRNALRAKYGSMGINLDDQQFEMAAERFVGRADRVKMTHDADIVMSVTGGRLPQRYQLVRFLAQDSGKYGAAVWLRSSEGEESAMAEGNGTIDAAAKAIDKIVDRGYLMENFSSVSKGRGSDATASTMITVTKNGWRTFGCSTHQDVVTSAIQAYIKGCNRMMVVEQYFGK